jgi:hypothetical protein
MKIIVKGDVIINCNTPLNTNLSSQNEYNDYPKASKLGHTEDEPKTYEEKISKREHEDETCKILDSLITNDGDFVFDANDSTQTDCWTCIPSSGDQVIANIGIKNLSMGCDWDEFNQRVDIAVTKQMAIELCYFLNGLDLD